MEVWKYWYIVSEIFRYMHLAIQTTIVTLFDEKESYKS